MEAIGVTELRKNMKDVLDRVVRNEQELIIHRPNEEDLLLMPLSEYNSLKETLHLLSSEPNRKRLEKGMKQIETGKVHKIYINEL